MHHSYVFVCASSSLLLLDEKAEEAEDMWHIYNLICKGDGMRTTTVRRIQNESNTGTVTSERVKLTLTLAVEVITFDATTCELHLKGKNITENEHVKLGAYHTLDIELNKKFTLVKEFWDTIALERLAEACDASASAEIAAVLLQEGLCHIFLLTKSLTITRARIEANVPRKRAGSSNRDKALIKFFDAVVGALTRHINFSIVKVVLIGSPAFVKETFLKHMLEDAVRRNDRLIIENKSKFVLCKASSAHRHALREAMMDPHVFARLSDTRAAKEIRALQEFKDMVYCGGGGGGGCQYVSLLSLSLSLSHFRCRWRESPRGHSTDPST
jgi:protein pelota